MASKKPVAFTDADFPELPETRSYVQQSSGTTNWSDIVNQYAQKCDEIRNKVADVFDGEYDEDGLPIYGKIRFSNGNVYRGPIFTEWPKYDEWELENEMSDEPVDFNYDSYDYYGEMTYPDGSTFYGMFCFGKSVISTLVKM
jgi:hypothetical protein